MILNVSTSAADVMLDAVAGLMDAGSIELLTSDSELLVTLRLSVPAAEPAIDGELQLNKIAEGDAVLTGVARFARVVAADGREIFTCDVGAENSVAVIKFKTPQIDRGDPVRLNSFKLVLPYARLFCNARHNIDEGRYSVSADEFAGANDNRHQPDEKEKGDPGPADRGS
jgi:hypothetical protein